MGRAGRLLAAGLLLAFVIHSPAPADPAVPSLRFVHPLNGESVSGPLRLRLEASAAHPIGEVTVVRGGEILGIDMDAPYELLWDTTKESDGPYVLIAKARDVEFHEMTARITVTVDNTLPTAAWTAPPQGTVASGTVHLAAEAGDILGLRSVKFLANGQVVGEAARAPYEINWDTSGVPNSRYAMQARAVDLAGNSTITDPVMIKIANFNRYPTLHPVGSKSVAEGSVLSFTLGADDPDGARDPLTFRVTGLPPWASFDEKTREVRGTPGVKEATLEHPAKVYDHVKIEVCDPEPLCDHEEISITVTDSNQAPVVINPGYQVVKEGEVLTFGTSASDPDHDPLTCHAKLLPKWAAFNSKTCTFTGVPGELVASLSERTVTFKPVKFEYCDDAPLCTTQEIAIDVLNVNAPPAWNPIDAPQAEEGQLWEMRVSAMDPDGDKLNLKPVWLPDGADLNDQGNGTAQLRWTPRADQSGKYEAVIEATDRDLTTKASFVIQVAERIPALSGLILDKDKKPVSGVTIKMFYQGKLEKTGVTDASGYYLITGFRPVAYEVTPDYQLKVGFTTGAQKLKGVVFDPTGFDMIGMRDEDKRGADFMVSFQ